MHIRKLTGDEYMLTAHGDGTFSIPNGMRWKNSAIS